MKKDKKIFINVPGDMDSNTAQQCFLLGLKAYTSSNNEGLCVIHGIERDEDTALVVMAFKGEYATAVLKFCQGVRYLSEKDGVDKNLAIMRDKGADALRELEKKGQSNATCGR